MVGLLRHKTDVVSALWDILVRVDNVKLLCSDQGGEYLGSRMAWTGESSIRLHPQHNGVAERFNRMVQDMLQSYLMDVNLADKYWAEALLMLVHLKIAFPPQQT